MQLEARTTGSEGMVAMLPHARAAAARSLQIDPDLAQAHGVYALLIGNDTRNGIAHLRRAAALDSNSADGLIWQSQAEHASGRFASAMSLNRRAHDIDVLWMNPVMMMVDLHASLSERQAAEAAARVAFADDALMEQFALARIAWLLGDYSEAGRRWSIVSHSSSRWTAPSQLSLENVKYLLKLTTNRPSRAPLPSLIHSRYGPRLWTTVAPSPPEWRNRNRSNEAALVYRDDNELAAKLMLAAGRAGELVATYDSNVGLMAIRQDEPMGLCMLQDVPTLALALRAVGRAGEANALLVQAEALVRTVYRGGKVPAWFDDDAAGVWSVQGKLGLAMDALERAQRRGWVHAGPSDLELESEPAFQALRNLPRFRAIIVKRKSLLARERQQALRDIA